VSGASGRGCIIRATHRNTGRTVFGRAGKSHWLLEKEIPYVEEVKTRAEAEAQPFLDESFAEVQCGTMMRLYPEWCCVVIPL